ncbi:hypothetical protein EXY23_24000, partial [Roseicella aquatilis]
MPIGSPGEPRAVIDIVLLHAKRGVALLEAPPHWTEDAPQRLRRRLERALFTSLYPGTLPIVHVPLRRDALAELPQVLGAAFAAEPPLDLPGGDAWMRAVSRALTAAPVPGASHRSPPLEAPQPAPPRSHHPWTFGAGGLGLALAALAAGAFLLRPEAPPNEPPLPASMAAGSDPLAIPAASVPPPPPPVVAPALLRLAVDQVPPPAGEEVPAEPPPPENLPGPADPAEAEAAFQKLLREILAAMPPEAGAEAGPARDSLALAEPVAPPSIGAPPPPAAAPGPPPPAGMPEAAMAAPL